MKEAAFPTNEAERLQALAAYDLIGSLPEKVYEDITRLACEICRTPISLIGLMEKDNQWFKAKQGMKGDGTPREYTFCSHAMLNPDDIMIVPDARQDERFHDNPFTTGDPYVVFYAGVSLVNPDGYALGTLCVIDRRPRTLTENQISSLKALGRWVATEFELRKTKMALEKKQQNLQYALHEKLKMKHVLQAEMSPHIQEILHSSETLLNDSSQADQTGAIAAIRQAGNSLQKLLGN
ncbi:GAF domain-containing protein [Larkinella terrae]|uniref:GAF domain-containing protein n=1 Tax=Larkinella terrae TaxID=2025311 RepID=A0A7K0EGM2_9BACT|nr:GAF domain-containing protein [Larkinella terrae]MRS60915.1 GAF domain-containing protein [Larkinella terrae]